MKRKLSKEYMPVWIKELDAWKIILKEILGEPVEALPDLETVKKNGSVPMSLELIRLKELSKESFYTDKNSTMEYTDILINVNIPAAPTWNTVFESRFFSDDLEKIPSDNKEELSDECATFIAEKKACKESYEAFLAAKAECDGTEGAKKLLEEKKEQNKKCNRKLSTSIKNMTWKYCSSKLERNDINRLASLIRHKIYNDGFLAIGKDGKPHRYVLYKRSASKAKTGACLFIREDLYKPMMDWTWFGLNPDRSVSDGKEYDITSMRAYEALALSNIENTVSIDPKSILIIDDVHSDAVPGNRRIIVKGEKEGEVKLLTPSGYKRRFKKDYEVKNNIWDGQALVDRSIFVKAGYRGKSTQGMMLLRNRFFKACAFNTNIRDYYRDHGIEEVYDAFGRKMNAKDVKMIITRDSVKFLKFADDLFSGDEKKAYDHWIASIEPVFGIVKTEHASNLGHGQYHEISYQILNSLPLSRTDMEEVMAEEIRYLNLLKSDPAVFLHHIEGAAGMLPTFYAKYVLYKHFAGYEQTKEFRQFRDNMVIKKYREKLEYGRIKVRGDMYVLCSMPYEMLEYSGKAPDSTEKKNKTISKPLLGPGQAFIQGEADGEDLAVFRYPHISSGAVCCLQNRVTDQISSILDGDNGGYFNFRNVDGSNIIVISPWESNIMIRLGGADFDSDTVLCIKDETIKKAAQTLKSIEALGPDKSGELPVAVVDDTLKGNAIRKSYTADSMADIDDLLASNKIGVITYDAELFNSYLWEMYFGNDKGKVSKMKQIYECVLLLSALNELEIDKAKHNMVLDTNEVEKKIRSRRYIEDKEPIIRWTKSETIWIEPEIRNKLIYPYFLYINRNRKSGKDGSSFLTLRDDEFWNCPVDHIPSILKEKIERRKKGESEKDWNAFLSEIVDEEKKYTIKDNDHYKEAYKVILAASDDEKNINMGRLGDGSEGDARDDLKEQVMRKLKSRQLEPGTIVMLFKKTYERYKKSANGHKKGEYKCPEVAADPEIRRRFMGYLFMWAAQESQEKGKSNYLLEWLKADEHPRQTLNRKKPAGSSKNPANITIWGEKYYYVTEED